MGRKIVAIGTVLLVASSAFADTKNGNANNTSWARYSFIAPSNGEFNASIVWTNADVDLWALLVCRFGSDDFVVADGLGFQDRTAHLVVGLPGGVLCTLFITTLEGATAFRLHAQHSADLSIRQGTEPLELREDGISSTHEAIANQRLQLRLPSVTP